MAEIKYRTSATAPVPSSTGVKGTPLTNLEIDGNFRSIKEDLDSKATTTQVNTAQQVAIDNALALSIALG